MMGVFYDAYEDGVTDSAARRYGFVVDNLWWDNFENYLREYCPVLVSRLNKIYEKYIDKKYKEADHD